MSSEHTNGHCDIDSLLLLPLVRSTQKAFPFFGTKHNSMWSIGPFNALDVNLCLKLVLHISAKVKGGSQNV